jgi:hypothetical protein
MQCDSAKINTTMIHITYLSGNETFLTRPIDPEALKEVLRKADDIYTITEDGKPITETLIGYLLHQAAADWVKSVFPGHVLPGLRCACPPSERHGETTAWCCNECGLPVE